MQTGSYGLPFTKMQAVGNDFVIVEAERWPETTDWTVEAVALCDRHFGVGGDGLLVISSSAVADFRMRMFNPDGTEDMCGNGLRCVIQHAVDSGRFDPARQGRTGTAETLAGIRAFRLEDKPEALGSELKALASGKITVEMGQPQFEPAALPLIPPPASSPEGQSFPLPSPVLNYPLVVEGQGTITVSAVNTGTTHTVIWCDSLPDDAFFFGLSPRIEHHPQYPERTSVLWTQVTDSSRLRLRIWERGVGETLGCGTGACAAAVLAACEQKIIPFAQTEKRRVFTCTVESKGGALLVYFELWAQGSDFVVPGNLKLTGPAQAVYSGVWHGT